MPYDTDTSPLPPPQPLPVPPPSQSRLKRWHIAAIVVGLVVLALSIVGSLAYVAVRGLPLMLGFEPPQMRYRGVWWADGGRFAVVQSADKDGRPFVLVWEKATRRTRRVDGRRVVAVEPHAAEIWLMPDTGAARGEPMGFDPLAEGADPVPRVLIRWPLDDGQSPARVTTMTVEWRQWPGPAGRTARFVVDRRRGGWPSRIVFGSRDGTSAETPDLEGTLAPIGWSPSGRYFAAYVLERPLSKAEMAELPDEGDEGIGPAWTGDARRVIFDASNGKPAAQEDTGENGFIGGAPWGAWDAERDLLYYPYVKNDPGDEDGPPEEMEMGVAALDPANGRRSDAFTLNGWPMPTAFDKTEQIIVLGGGPKGPVFVTDIPEGETWRLGPSGPRRLDVVTESGLPAAWSENGGMLSYTMEDGVAVLREDGSTEAELLPASR